MKKQVNRRMILGSALGLGLFGLVGSASAQTRVVRGAQWGDQFDAQADGGEQVSSNIPVLSSATVSFIQIAISQYEAIVAQGGWPHVPQEQGQLQLGINHPTVEILRRRLFISGDLAREAGLSIAFDSYVDAAVRRFQVRHGLPANGIVNDITYRAINVSADARLQQLRVNLSRLQKDVVKTDREQRFVMVNIPAAQIEAVEDGSVAQRYTAVVGKIDRQTPLLDSKINEVILNPTWTVPTSIIKKDLIPLMRKNPNYLAENNIHIYNSKGQEVSAQSVNWNTDEATRLRFRQDPGKINAMSSTKINFYNTHSVYMHDTPQQSLFNNLMRFDSSGCIRIHNIRDFNVWVLKDTANWDRARMEQVIAQRVNTPIRVTNPIALHFVYITAWSTGSGVTQFRDDIYHFDGVRELAFSGL